MAEIPKIQEHKFAPVMRFYQVSQQAIANHLGISQASVSQQLSGSRPMKERVEDYLKQLITSLREMDREKAKKHKKIVKKKEAIPT
ncbi:MAG: hypothetical protein ABIE47_14780 [Pseudomonadota bacterium]